MIRTIFTVAALSAAVFAGSACAQDRVADERSVATSNIDFTNPDKVHDLYGRIRAAATAVCTSEVSDPATANADRACEAQSVREAVAQIGQPELTRLAERDRDIRSGSTQLASRDSDRRMR